MRSKGKYLTVLAGIILATSICTVTPAYAKSLAKSFSGYTNLHCVGYVAFGGTYWKKSCTAQTDGYKGRHYVRAYIGGNINSPNGAWVDSGRVYSNGNIKKTVYTDKVYISSEGSSPKWYFPTGYAKYGY